MYGFILTFKNLPRSLVPGPRSVSDRQVAADHNGATLNQRILEEMGRKSDRRAPQPPATAVEAANDSMNTAQGFERNEDDTGDPALGSGPAQDGGAGGATPARRRRRKPFVL
jgi:hypothetical protein